MLLSMQPDSDYQVASYPATPWRMGGEAWLSLFRADAAVPVPQELNALAPGWLAVLLVRYREGTLRYDELIFGTAARYGWRVGLHVDRIWVDDLQSLWGGRRIWGLGKDLAEFAWQGERVSVADEEGLIAQFRVNTAPARLPRIWLPIPSFGARCGRLSYFVGSMRGRPAFNRLEVLEWAGRFPYRPLAAARFGLAVKPFRAEFPDPVFLR